MRHHILVGILLFISASCTVSNRDKNDQLSEVAKGWSRTIRASQVIPVYPLTEDVQVGDIFIVQRPIEDEVELWNEKGFLPLGHHLERLWPDAQWQEFYKHKTYGVGGSVPPPPLFQHLPPPPASDGGASQPASDTRRHRLRTNWPAGPRAAFPSYSFTISRSGGVDAGLPIQGVPVAVSLLGGQTSAVTVTLNDAYTYGLDTESMYSAVTEWGARNVDLLRNYEPVYKTRRGGWPDRQFSYLRVVTRVYMVGGVNVTATDAHQGTGGLSLGSPRTVPLIKPATNPSDYQEWIDELNSGLSGEGGGDQPDTKAAGAAAAPGAGAAAPSLPGGTVRVASFTGRSVTLNETFDRPLVVGYLAFDLPIGESGVLGARPISTQLRLEDVGESEAWWEVDRFVERNPDAELQLARWLHQENGRNHSWLVSNYAKEFRKYLDRDLDPQSPGVIEPWELRDRLNHQPLFGRIIGQKWPMLNHRIVAEVIQRPEGFRPEMEQWLGYYYGEAATRPTTQPVTNEQLRSVTEKTTGDASATVSKRSRSRSSSTPRSGSD